MKHLCKTLATAPILAFSILHSPFSIPNSSAAVPLEWTARPGETAPAQFTRHHGETLELRCRFAGFGDQPFSQGADIRLWYQTNGMSSAWWSVPAQAASNTLSAVFAPESDPGADLVRLFFGAPSNVYASAVLRLRPSPGAAPNALPPPEGFAEADPVFAAWLATDPFSGLAPAGYETVSNRALSAVQPADMAAAIAAATNALPAAATDLTPATNYTDAVAATLRAKADMAVYEDGFTEWEFSDGVTRAVSVGYDLDTATQFGHPETPWYVYAVGAYGMPRTWFATEDEANACLEFVFNVESSGPSGTEEVTATRSPAVVPTADRLATTTGVTRALAAATNAVYTVLDGLPDIGSVLATNASGYVDKTVRGLFFTSEWDASPQNVKLWQPQMDWLEINFLGMGGYKFTLPSTSGIVAPYEPWMVQYAPDLVMRWVDVTNEIAGIDYEARVGEVLTNRLGAVSIGYHAKASAGGFGAVAIGSNTTATANCAVAIGANSDATATAGIAIGCDAGASGANGIAVGLGAAATAQKGIAIGQGAKAYASSAVQIGTGSNSAEGTVNFYGACVFSNGTLVVEGGGDETPAEVTVTGTVPYSKGLVNLTVTSGGTLACNTNDWPNGAQVLVSATLPAAYTAASGVEPVGYSSMPTDGQYLLVFTRIWGKVYVSVITSEE